MNFTQSPDSEWSTGIIIFLGYMAGVELKQADYLKKQVNSPFINRLSFRYIFSALCGYVCADTCKRKYKYWLSG